MKKRPGLAHIAKNKFWTSFATWMSWATWATWATWVTLALVNEALPSYETSNPEQNCDAYSQRKIRQYASDLENEPVAISRNWFLREKHKKHFAK